MNDKQFDILINKLEEIRCGIIDVESAQENTNQITSINISANELREEVHNRLEVKTGWGRNEVKTMIDEAIIACYGANK